MMMKTILLSKRRLSITMIMIIGNWNDPNNEIDIYIKTIIMYNDDDDHK